MNMLSIAVADPSFCCTLDVHVPTNRSSIEERALHDGSVSASAAHTSMAFI
jgi:hypothetical protein